MRPIFSSILAASLLAACGTSSGGGAPEGGSPSDGGGPPGNVVIPPDGTGSGIVDRLGAASSACGQQSGFTVPGGWQLLAVGDAGCTVWVPPGWTLEGAHTGIATAMQDGSGREGFVGIAGASQDVACSPAPVRDSVLQGFADKGFGAPEVLWHLEQSTEFGGTVWPTGHAVFGTSVGGTPLVGYLWVLTTQTVIACDVVGLGFWEPESAIESDTCALTQIINSVKCPSGGGCDDASCDTECKGGGAAGGACNASGGCDCY